MTDFAKAKKSTLLICFIFVGFFAQAQLDTVFIRRSPDRFADTLTYKVDTVLLYNSFSKILYGTMKLPGSNFSLDARYGYGYGLDSVYITPCNNSIGPEGESKIEYVTKSDSGINIQCKIYENCCHDFLCEVKVVEDSILSLDYIFYGENCGCTCCFGLNYVLNLDKSIIDFKRIKYFMLGENRKTLRNTN